MRLFVAALTICMLASAGHATDWEKFYKSYPSGSVPIVPSDQPPEIINPGQDLESAMRQLWRKGYALIGYSAFNSPNSKTKDAMRLGEKLKARYVMLGTSLTSSQMMNVPITTPTTTTSYSNGNASAYGSGGYAHGTYSGTTTTYGSQTTYVPIVQNRFDKFAAYFGPLAKQGMGVLFRAPTPEEIARLETRHALIVQAVRDESPADVANILEGDTLITFNGQGATMASLSEAVRSGAPIAVHLLRNGQARDLMMTIPEDWRPR
jgi:hypothetical protein